MKTLEHAFPPPALVGWMAFLLAASAPAATPLFLADPFSASDATEGVVYSDSIGGAATDPDDDPLTYAKVSGPGWLRIAPDGTLSGQPRAADAGANSFTVSVSDGIESAVEATLQIVVEATSGFVDGETPSTVQPLSGGADWQLTFSDEFNGTALDTGKWGVDVSTSSRAARPPQGIDAWYWKAGNVSLDGAGDLVLDVTKHDATTMHCGSISSDGIYEPQYGYMEARIRIADTTKSTHTAFWLQSGNMIGAAPDDDSAADGAEVDVFESAWFGNYTKAVVHIDGYGAGKNANTKQYSTPGLHSGYHVFGLEWTADSMKIYYDGVLKVTYTGSWVPQVPEWLWLSCGASFGDVGTFTSEPLGLLTSAHVDHVRVWQTLPPALAGSGIVDDRGGASIVPGTVVAYTVTFSEDMDESTVDAADFSNAGTSPVTVGAVVETAPGIFTVEATPTAEGTLQLEVPAGAVLTDTSGNPLDTSGAIVDDTALAVVIPDETPPSPNPMTFAAAPAAMGGTSISMTAATASDPSGVEYFFTCTAGGGNDSGWQDSPDYTDTGLTPETQYRYTVTARDKSPGRNTTAPSAESSATTDVLADVEDDADSEIPVAGTVDGGIIDTRSSDDSYQSLAERASGGKPADRHSYLEHKWAFTVTGGVAVSFHLEAHHTANGEGDEFIFAYSTTGPDGNYTDMVTVTKTADDDAAQTYLLPADTSGLVHVRVVDTDQSQGNRTLDTLFIDRMFFLSAGSVSDSDPPTPDPMAFASAPAAGGSTSIIMTAATASDPAGVEYLFTCTSGGGNDSGWQDSPGYTDTGLSPGTRYTYTVTTRDKSPDQNTSAPSLEASATTDALTDEEIWAADYPVDLSDMNADFDGDGLSNREEYLWGLDPTSARSCHAILTPLDPDTATFRYSRREPLKTGAVFSVWTSHDLGVWTEDAGALQGLVDVVNAVETVEVTLSALPFDGVLFVRIKATE